MTVSHKCLPQLSVTNVNQNCQSQQLFRTDSQKCQSRLRVKTVSHNRQTNNSVTNVSHNPQSHKKSHNLSHSCQSKLSVTNSKVNRVPSYFVNIMFGHFYSNPLYKWYYMSVFAGANEESQHWDSVGWPSQRKTIKTNTKKNPVFMCLDILLKITNQVFARSKL